MVSKCKIYLNRYTFKEMYSQCSCQKSFLYFYLIKRTKTVFLLECLKLN